MFSMKSAACLQVMKMACHKSDFCKYKQSNNAMSESRVSQILYDVKIHLTKPYERGIKCKVPNNLLLFRLVLKSEMSGS